MEAIIWDGSDYPAGLTYGKFEQPDVEPGWVKVHVRAVGICGSDIHLLLGHTKYLIPEDHYPCVLGHEMAGVVEEVGKGVTSVKPGDRVAVEPIHGCIEFGGSCPMCRIGKYQMCEKGMDVIGLPFVHQLPGGYGEYTVTHESRVFKIPENISLEEAATLDILAVDVHGLNIGKPQVGMTAAVYGCGVIGLDMIQCLRVAGITEIIGVAKYDFQAELAKKMGASEVVLLKEGVNPVAEVKRLTGMGVDQVYECVGGMTDAVNDSMLMCCPGGNVIMLGGGSRPRPIDLQAMLLLEVNILSSLAYSTWGTRREFQVALNLLRDGLVDNKLLISHRFKPQEYMQAFDMAINKTRQSTLKVMFLRD